MPRSRRLVIDDDTGWHLRAEFLSNPLVGRDGTVDHGDVDYILFAADGSGDEIRLITPGLYDSPANAFQSFVIWGKGVISFGVPTAEQIAFMAAASEATDLSQFPGAFIEAGYVDPAITDIYVGIRNPLIVGLAKAFTTIAFGTLAITIFGDRITVTGGELVIDLGTGVRLTPANAAGGTYHLASLIRTDGSPGDDVLAGTGAAQTIHGNEGNDTITAGAGASDLFGDLGNDTLTGGIGKDRLFGGDGNDTIKGNPGDTADGGADNDLIIAGRGMAISGGEGIDRLLFDFAGSALPIDIALPDGPDGEVASLGTSFNSVERIDIKGGLGNDTLRGNDQANTIRGGAGADVIDGGAGSDVLDAGVGGPAPELPVSAFSFEIDAPVAIDGAFGAKSGASPQAVIALPNVSIFSTITGFYSFDVAEGANLVVTSSVGDFLSDDYGVSLFDADLNFIAINTSGAPLDVLNLAAGRYVLQITSQGLDRIGLAEINLSSAVPPDRKNVLTGGLGDDTFFVHAAEDVVIEAANLGRDIVIADLSWKLSANVEALTLKSGAGAINGGGNVLDNKLIGNESNNTLNGGGGGDVLIGGGGRDVLRGNSGADRMEGGSGGDTLIGGGGRDMLSGDSGADRMEGGEEDDFYRVENAGDQVVELTGEGIDTVSSKISLTLAANVENLHLSLTTGALDGTGNALANTLIGNGADNVLDGAAGSDLLLGGAGNDTYHVDNRTDQVYETAAIDSTVDAGGSDTVISTVSYSLAAPERMFVENLTLTGTAVIEGKGNELANRIKGNAAANTIMGRGGDDTLTGDNGDDLLLGGTGNDLLIAGAGKDRLDPGTGKDTMTGGSAADVFVFSNEAVSDAVSKVTADRITDFSHAERDRIDLRGIDANSLITGDQAFTFLGTAAFTGKAGELRIERSGIATYIVGDLTGDGAADSYIRLAPGLTLVAGDFLL